jgi:hypothetical protein
MAPTGVCARSSVDPLLVPVRRGTETECLGCGITGYSLDDATAIVRQEVFSRYGARQING